MTGNGLGPCHLFTVDEVSRGERGPTMDTDTYTPWQLASMADCMSPDAVDSPGAKWLELVASSAQEMLEDNPEATEDELSEDITERADGLVPIYTHERWQVFVDLGAYLEDPTELGATADDMEQCAGVCLFIIAERLIGSVLAELIETRDEDEGEDQ